MAEHSPFFTAEVLTVSLQFMTTVALFAGSYLFRRLVATVDGLEDKVNDINTTQKVHDERIKHLEQKAHD